MDYLGLTSTIRQFTLFQIEIDKSGMSSDISAGTLGILACDWPEHWRQRKMSIPRQPIRGHVSPRGRNIA